MKRLLITGGSGFIGTNIVELFLEIGGYYILNIDVAAPKIQRHKQFWKQIDITDKSLLIAEVTNFNPNYVIHLAARTDLRGKSLEDYPANVVGVENLLNALDLCSSLERVVFTSSMYVCEPSYAPKDFEDYFPHTYYGESKVLTEKIIKQRNPQDYTWCIIRPTSIWGPWFGEPYLDFFNIVLNKRYLHLGNKACVKTYGYVENTVSQIYTLLNESKEQVHEKVFYLGDLPAYNISEWADEIAEYVNFKIPRVPFVFFRLIAILGDLFKVFGIKFPMTSFRLKNMTTNNVHNLDLIMKISPHCSVSRIEGVKTTINWIMRSK